MWYDAFEEKCREVEELEARIAAVRQEIEAQSINGGWHYEFVIKPALLSLCGE